MFNLLINKLLMSLPREARLDLDNTKISDLEKLRRDVENMQEMSSGFLEKKRAAVKWFKVLYSNQVLCGELVNKNIWMERIKIFGSQD